MYACVLASVVLDISSIITGWMCMFDSLSRSSRAYPACEWNQRHIQVGPGHPHQEPPHKLPGSELHFSIYGVYLQGTYYVEIEPDLWRSTIYFLRSWLISFDFPMMSIKEALSLKVGLKYIEICGVIET